MEQRRTPQKVLRIAVAVSIIFVIVMTAVAAVVSYLIVSGQDRSDPEENSESLPMYQASALLLLNTNEDVNSRLTTDTDRSDKADLSDPKSYETMANTVAKLLSVDPQMKSLMAGADVTVEPVENSYFIRITASAKDGRTAANVANMMADTGCDVYREYFDTGKLTIAEIANVPSKPAAIETESTENKTDVTSIVLIAALSALSVGMIIAIILTAAIYTSYKKKYNRQIVNYYGDTRPK